MPGSVTVLVGVFPDLAVGGKQDAGQDTRKIRTPRPIRLRSSILGSEAQARKVATSWASWSMVALVPSE